MLAVFEQVKNPQAASIARGFGTAAFLLLLVLVLFVVARIIGGRGPGNLTPRQRRRRMKRSRDDLERIEAADRTRTIAVSAPHSPPAPAPAS